MKVEERLEILEAERERIDNALARVKRINVWLMVGVVWAVFSVIVMVIAVYMETEKSRELALMPNRIFDTVFVKNIKIVDDDGNALVSMGATEAGPGMNMSDKNGEIRFGLVVPEFGPVLSLYDEEGESRFTLMAGRQGIALGFSDKAGNPRAVLGDIEAGLGLGLFDEKGRPRIDFVVTQEGPRLGVFDEYGQAVWSAP